jgi:CHAT domain-containing protein
MDSRLESSQLIRVFKEVEDGALPITEAVRQVSQSTTFVFELDDEALQQLTRRALELSKTDEWRSGVRLSTLVSTALAKDARRYIALAPYLTAPWIDTLGAALWHVADPRLYERALSLARAIEPHLIATRARRRLADLYFALGILHLDPVAADRGDNAAKMWDEWIARDDTWDGASLRFMDRSAILNFRRMIERAQVYLRASARCYGEEPGRGLAMKAFAQAVLFRPVVNLPARKRTARRASSVAIKYLTGTRHKHALAEAQRYLISFGENLEQPSGSTRIASDPLPDVPNDEPGRARYLANLIEIKSKTNHLGALADILSVYPTIVNDEDEPVRISLLEMQTRLIVEIGQAQYPDESTWDTFVSETMQALNEGVDPKDGLSRMRVLARALACANASIPLNREASALQVLERLHEMFSGDMRQLDAPVIWMLGVLQSNCGVLAFNRGNYDESGFWYCRALPSLLEANLPQMAMGAIRSMHDVAQHLTPEGAETVSMKFGEVAEAARVLLPQSAAGILVELHERLQLARGAHINPDLTLYLWSLAKGRAFASAQTVGGRSIRRTPALDAARDRIESESPVSSRHIRALLGEAGSVFEETLLLSPYSERQVELAGDNPASRRAYLQLTYERAFWDAIRQLPSDFSTLCTRESIHQSVPEDAVVLVQYVARDGDHDIVFQMLWSRAQTKMVASQLPPLKPTMLDLEIGPIHLQPRQLPVSIGFLRDAIQEDPDPEKPCSIRARQMLDQMSKWIVSPLRASLSELHRVGKRRLIVVPHGPLHFLPFHLLTTDDVPIGADWLVTYAPNLASLAKPPTSSAAATSYATIGLGFRRDDRGLAEIPEALAEARMVVQIVGGTALFDDDGSATKGNVFRALQSARRVHIASHGTHNPIAPMFQCLYVVPDNGAPLGELYAHEIAQCDLRHIEFVTLSACETALGRVDEADNLRGLPAAFFLAGAQAVIGTLWDVETESAKLFFETFYQSLAGQASAAEAFASAQRVVRSKHPEFRDWGAFQMISNQFLA